ncbi:hypothetical protein HRG_012894 [Hirsutella rhossiliensis]
MAAVIDSKPAPSRKPLRQSIGERIWKAATFVSDQVDEVLRDGELSAEILDEFGSRLVKFGRDVRRQGGKPLNQLNQRVKLSRLTAYISEPLVELSNPSPR